MVGLSPIVLPFFMYPFPPDADSPIHFMVMIRYFFQHIIRTIYRMNVANKLFNSVQYT